MTDTITITRANLREGMTKAFHEASALCDQGGCEVVLKALDARTAEQNRKMWAALADISHQVDWHGVKPTKEEWKDILSASLRRQKVMPGIDGGFVVVGLRTSKLSRKDFAELITLIDAFGAGRGVNWSDPEFQSMVAAESAWLDRKKAA